jgi:hypothetical protein
MIVTAGPKRWPTIASTIKPLLESDLGECPRPDHRTAEAIPREPALRDKTDASFRKVPQSVNGAEGTQQKAVSIWSGLLLTPRPPKHNTNSKRHGQN